MIRQSKYGEWGKGEGGKRKGDGARMGRGSEGKVEGGMGKGMGWKGEGRRGNQSLHIALGPHVTLLSCSYYIKWPQSVAKSIALKNLPMYI